MRVDRTGGSPLGNPYVMRGEREREAVCDAYARLMASTMRHGGRACDQGWVRKVGELAGFWGEVREWDFAAAREETRALAQDARRWPMTLACHCAPKRCHAETVCHYIRKG